MRFLPYSDCACLPDIDECTTNPCSNGARCVNIDGSYVCNCPSGWTASLCTIGLLKKT